MYNVEYYQRELIRMRVKRQQICIELGCNYDWQLHESLNAITQKISSYESKIEELI